MNKKNMNWKETFFAESFAGVTLAFAGAKLEAVSEFASMGANLFAMAVSCIAIFTFIRNEKEKRKKN